MEEAAPRQTGSFRHLRLEGSRLTVLRELPYHDRELEVACRLLLDDPGPELVIDLVRLEYLASVQIGALVAASTRAAEAGRRLRVLVRPSLVKFLGRLKLEGLLGYEVVEPSREG